MNWLLLAEGLIAAAYTCEKRADIEEAKGDMRTGACLRTACFTVGAIGQAMKTVLGNDNEGMLR